MNLDPNYQTPILQTNQQPGYIVQQAHRNEPTLQRKVCAATAGILSGSATAIMSLGTLGIMATLCGADPVAMSVVAVTSLYFGGKVGRSVNNKILQNGN